MYHDGGGGGGGLGGACGGSDGLGSDRRQRLGRLSSGGGGLGRTLIIRFGFNSSFFNL